MLTEFLAHTLSRLRFARLLCHLKYFLLFVLLRENSDEKAQHKPIAEYYQAAKEDVGYRRFDHIFESVHYPRP